MNVSKFICPTTHEQVSILHDKEILTGIGDFTGVLHTYLCSRQRECEHRKTTECIVRKKEILQSK